MEWIAGDVQDQVIKMDVDQQPPSSHEGEWPNAKWANSLGDGFSKAR